MKKLCAFHFWDRLQAAMLKEILAEEGIECVLRNDQLSSAIGEIPFIECSPELWVIDDEAYPRAKVFLENWLKNDPTEEEDWTCASCGEQCAAQFGACWSCGTLRD
ncbi:MAG: DUF2007 domain-containing protein [Desulfuromonadales bacterium]|nr:DUF2007 domain-containing protein [Desulfuromonadales bacterium]MBN2792177.1 DUF2007 domain-containing protein [Desulfuromonadales bacterium]